MEINNKFGWTYRAGFFIILSLPILTIPPYFFPPDFGKTVVFRSILAVMVFLLLYQIIYKKNSLPLPGLKGTLKNNKIIWASAVLFIVFLLASIFSVDPYFSFWGSPDRGGGFVSFAFYFVFTILLFILVKKDDWKKLWIFSILIGILVSLVALSQFYGLFNHILSSAGRPASTMGNPIILAIYILFLFFVTLPFALKEKNKHLKIFYICALAIFLLTILITGSRSAYFGIIAGILYFVLFYPASQFDPTNQKKLKILKICLAFFLIFGLAGILFININSELPKFLQNRVTQAIADRLSIKQAFNDERFLAWEIALKEVAERPILGWGPENFSVGFDKNYDPKINPTPWWDRAHNMFLDVGSQTGVLGIIGYILFFIALFWQLKKIKNTQQEPPVANENPQITAHAIQAAIVGYLVANFFSFDSFGTYIIFFLLVAYSLHLTPAETENPHESAIIDINPWAKHTITTILFCALIVFIYQYNILPIKINAQINKAASLVDQKDCHQGFTLMENILPEHSFVDSYARLEYGEFTRICSGFYPENNLAYLKTAIKPVIDATKIQPLYTRYWIFLGQAATALASQEQNPEIKISLISQANNYYNKALQLAPKHQEIFIGLAKMGIVAGNYKSAQNYSEQCILLNPDIGSCYWYLALSEIYQKNIDGAKKDIQTASDKKYGINSGASLLELSNAYGSIPDYQELVSIYKQLITADPRIAQYHSSLAFFYKQLGEYEKARQEAMIALEFSPESKENVDDFLKTLPR